MTRRGHPGRSTMTTPPALQNSALTITIYPPIVLSLQKLCTGTLSACFATPGIVDD